jgi:hypothetical protein
MYLLVVRDETNTVCYTNSGSGQAVAQKPKQKFSVETTE